MRQNIYQRGDIVTIVSVDARLRSLGFRPGQEFRVWIDYEDLIYLESPVKYRTKEDYFYPEQLRFT